MTFVAVLAGNSRRLASDVGKQGLDVAPPRQVQTLLRSALVGDPLPWFARQSLRKRALDVEVLVTRFPREFLRHLDQGRLNRLVGWLHLLRGTHLGLRLVLLLMLMLVGMLNMCDVW